MYSNQFYSWLQTDAGNYFLSQETVGIEQTIRPCLGETAIQLGMPHMNFLANSKIPNQFIVAEELPSYCPFQVTLSAFTKLPFDNCSVELAVLPHTLECHPEVQIEILSELCRVLNHQGRIILTTFNPYSLWNAYKKFNRHALPVKPMGLKPLSNLLKEQGFTIDRGHYSCYALPFSSERWLNKCAPLEKAGNRWWPTLGASYLLSARKNYTLPQSVGHLYPKYHAAT